MLKVINDEVRAYSAFTLFEGILDIISIDCDANIRKVTVIPLQLLEAIYSDQPQEIMLILDFPIQFQIDYGFLLFAADLACKFAEIEAGSLILL